MKQYTLKETAAAAEAEKKIQKPKVQDKPQTNQNGGPNLVKYLNQRIDNFQSQMFNQTVMLNSKTESSNNPLLPQF